MLADWGIVLRIKIFFSPFFLLKKRPSTEDVDKALCPGTGLMGTIESAIALRTGSSNLPRNPIFKTDFAAFPFVIPAALTWTHPQPAIRMPRIISRFLYFFQLTLPYSKMTAAPLARVPFLVPPCQPMERSFLASLNWEASLDSSSPPCLTLEQVLAHPTLTFPQTLLLMGQVKLGHQHPSLVYCLVPPKWSPCSRPAHSWVSVLSACYQPPFSACST